MSQQDLLIQLNQVAEYLSHEKSQQAGFEYIAKDLWQGRFDGQGRLPPTLDDVECNRAYLADLILTSQEEIQSAIDCLLEDGLVDFYDPVTHLPTAFAQGAWVSLQQMKSLLQEHHVRNMDRVKQKFRDIYGFEGQLRRAKASSGAFTPEDLHSSVNDLDNEDNEWPQFFPNLAAAGLQKAFPEGNWSEYTGHAKRNGLIRARVSRGKYNVYLAGFWWLYYVKPKGYDVARLRRILAKNLLPEHEHLGKRLSGELE